MWFGITLDLFPASRVAGVDSCSLNSTVFIVSLLQTESTRGPSCHLWMKDKRRLAQDSNQGPLYLKSMFQAQPLDHIMWKFIICRCSHCPKYLDLKSILRLFCESFLFATGSTLLLFIKPCHYTKATKQQKTKKTTTKVPC